MPDTLELYLLDTGAQALALGRCDAHVAIENIPIDADCRTLGAYRRRIEGVVLGTEPRLKNAELRQYGEELFRWLFRGKLQALYAQVPKNGLGSVQILSNRPELKEMPWEFLQLPDRAPTPHRERCVVRVTPTCGVNTPPPKPKSKLKVLFVSADPMELSGVPWPQVEAAIRRAYEVHLPAAVEMKTIEGATRSQLVNAVRSEGEVDIFHFVGHGTAQGDGQLALVNSKTHKRDLISGYQLAQLLSGKGVRLAILSACLSSAGDATDDFSPVASTLLASGIPAVVANQVSIPSKSVAAFVGALYAKLLETGDIDKAMMEGRIALAADLIGAMGTDAVVDWGIPTLYRLSDARQIFK